MQPFLFVCFWRPYRLNQFGPELYKIPFSSVKENYTFWHKNELAGMQSILHS